MKNLKQLLTDRKYLEAKTLILSNLDSIEESIDILLEIVEESRAYVLTIPEPKFCNDENELLLRRVREANDKNFRPTIEPYPADNINERVMGSLKTQKVTYKVRDFLGEIIWDVKES